MTEETKPEVTTGKFVTVCCKLPHGLWMELAAPGKPITRILARGCNSTNIVGGYGITENVPKEFWDAWFEDHQGLKFVKNEQIWAYNTVRGAKSKALEMAEIKHGMERLDVSKLPPGLEKGKIE
jgi:hypothetical protein